MNLLRYLPAIDELQQSSTFQDLLRREKMSKKGLTVHLQGAVKDVREMVLGGGIEGHDELGRPALTEMVFRRLEDRLRQFGDQRLRPVINATGVVLHTNLGRARLSESAIDHLLQVSSSYSSLEYDLTSHQRGSRHDIVEAYLQEITGAEAGLVLNNNAAAVYLVLTALAKGKEVIVSRGELVEIGGSFRISEIMAESGAQLVDVGTTNKTNVSDYEVAIGEETALLMKVHKSNFALIGFAEEVATDALKPLADKYDLPIYEDLGSGTLFDFRKHGIGNEPTVQEKVEAGIDLISFSGDKLLGGPQAGIIVGKKAYIDALKKHQLARVLRVDKFTLAALEATLKTYLRGRAAEEIPTLRDILQEAEVIKGRADRFIAALASQVEDFTLTLAKGESKIGGGTMPEVNMDTYLVLVRHPHLSAKELAKELRNHSLPIIVRLQEDHIVLDFRTVDEEEVQRLVEAFVEISRR